jgi:antitoxin MazE
MKTKLIPIGNSRGVRLPKPLIEEARLEDEVDISVRGTTIVISACKTPRQGWAEAAMKLHAAGGDSILIEQAQNEFDKDWDW